MGKWLPNIRLPDFRLSNGEGQHDPEEAIESAELVKRHSQTGPSQTHIFILEVLILPNLALLTLI